MRKLVILAALLAAFVARTTPAWASGVGAIPVAIVGALVEGVAGLFACHPDTEKLALQLDSIEIDGVAVTPSAAPSGLYLAADDQNQIVAVLADPTSDPPGAARDQALIASVRN